MSARYEIRDSKDDKFYWTLQADNNETLLSSETYNSKTAANNGAESAKRNTPYDERYVRKTASNGQHFFVLRAENHEPLGTSEMYITTAAREKGVTACKKVGPHAPIVDLTKTRTGAWR